MKIKSYRTHKITPGENILAIIDQYLPVIPDKSVLAITSKIISLCQKRVVLKNAELNKFELIKQEAEYYLEGDYSEKYGICLTIKNNLLIPTAGIDESNGNGYCILYPLDIQSEALKIWQHLRSRGVNKSNSANANANNANPNKPNKQIGILITDSHTTPLRRGVTGIALGWCGFNPLYSYIGKPDIFGFPLRVTQINMLDSLAASAVFEMGEGEEQTPLALLEEISKITFQETSPTTEDLASVTISMEDDLYAPLLTSVEWRKGGTV